ncbi:MAG: 2-amino-4-hydroxy-6-hydroxymethyldihydropteridine diphosphokinase [Gammaproteobacteria bacterium]
MKASDNPVAVVYIGLGSNLDNPANQIQRARSGVSALDRVEETAFSSLYGSPPMGPQDQPDYVNAVMEIRTDLPPLELLKRLQEIEIRQGRVRHEERWGARTIDLDLLLYAQLEINLPELTVPHPGMQGRAFVLYPLMEIAPDLTVPGLGPLAHLADNCPRGGLRRLP